MPTDPRDKSDSGDDFNARLDRALKKNETIPEDNDENSTADGFGRAMMVGVEFCSAIAIAAGLGMVFDYWLGTEPWGLIVFFFLGIAAAFLNIYRLVNNMGYDIGYSSDTNEDSPPNTH